MDSRSKFLYIYIGTIIQSIEMDKSQRFEVWDWHKMSNFNKTTVSGHLKSRIYTILVDFFCIFSIDFGHSFE